MPARASKCCSEPGCTRLTGRNARCPEHTRPAWSGPRTASADRTGNRKWRVKRAKVMTRDLGLCQVGLDGCTTTATEVHHIRECADVDDDSMANLVAICHECHQQITAESASAKSHGRSSRKRSLGGPPSDARADERARAGRPSTERADDRARGAPRSIIARY